MDGLGIALLVAGGLLIAWLASRLIEGSKHYFEQKFKNLANAEDLERLTRVTEVVKAEVASLQRARNWIGDRELECLTQFLDALGAGEIDAHHLQQTIIGEDRGAHQVPGDERASTINFYAWIMKTEAETLRIHQSIRATYLRVRVHSADQEVARAADAAYSALYRYIETIAEVDRETELRSSDGAPVGMSVLENAIEGPLRQCASELGTAREAYESALKTYVSSLRG